MARDGVQQGQVTDADAQSTDERAGGQNQQVDRIGFAKE